MNIHDLATKLSLPVWATRQLLASGHLKAKYRGPLIFITLAEFSRWSDSLPAEHP